MRYIAGKPAERIFASTIQHPNTHYFTDENLLSNQRHLNVLVWNIFKQQRAEWQQVLERKEQEFQLVLLQEAQTTPELIQFTTDKFMSVDQVPAVAFQHASGVMTLAHQTPLYCCPLREREPLLRLSKSALITVYRLVGQQLLMVVNIHAVNFSLGLNVYRKQLSAISDQLKDHQGPILLAGDFNAWSRQRSHALYSFIRHFSLREVRFTEDLRKTVFGRPLDFIFYRGMQVENASVIETQASDHNPLHVEFSF